MNKTYEPNMTLLKKLLTEMPMIFYAINNKYLFTLSEGRGLQKLGLQPGEVVGCNVKELYKNKPEILADINNAFQGNSVHAEHKLASFYFESFIIPIFSDNETIAGILGAAIDITDRKQTDFELKKSQQFQQALIDSIPGLLYLYDANAELTFWNKQHETLTGYSKEELDHFKLMDWYPNDPKSQEAVIKGLKDIQDVGFGEAEADLHLKDGSTLPFYFTACPLTLDHEDYFVGVGLDISSRKKMEKEMLELNQTLEKQVDLRTQQLLLSNQDLSKANEDLTELNQNMRTMNEQLYKQNEKIKKMQNYLIESEKMTALGELVAGVTHEINTPIGVGITASTHLSDVVTDLSKALKNHDLPFDISPYLEDIQVATAIIDKNLNRAGKLIHSFKNLSVDQSNEPKRKFYVEEYLQEILITLSPSLKKTNIQIAVQCDEKLTINGYPGAFAQIITNLVMNSITHAYDEKTPGTIRIKLESACDVILLTYSDDGKGISPEILKKIYDPFFTTRRGRGGTGLGLSVVYSIVTQQFEGTIKCQSVLGSGTTFIITLSTKGGLNDDYSNESTMENTNC
ncbi:ATP-binding protein [Eubacteriaceae bacterium ES2]|nr:ATP-binding protein [Eubacteriaceae bacterium ES2]